jgi:F0F1-type ATP synthase membrane subunit b/b'
MPDDERKRALARLKNQVARLAFDELEKWIRDQNLNSRKDRWDGGPGASYTVRG